MDHTAATSPATITDWIAPLVAANITSKVEDIAADEVIHHDDEITDPDVLVERLVQTSRAFDRALWDAVDVVIEHEVQVRKLPAEAEDLFREGLGDGEDFARAVLDLVCKTVDLDSIIDSCGGPCAGQEAAADYVRSESAALARRF